MNRSILSPRIKILTTALSIILGTSLSYFVLRPHESMVDFDVNRDRQFITEAFDNDWYWLTEYARGATDPIKQLELKAVSLNYPMTFGKLTTKVMYVKESFFGVNAYKPVGFVAYYMKSFYEGMILFLDVAHPYRRKGYAEKLMNYACNDLFNRGAQVIRLLTRPNNTGARALYNRLGFKEYKHDEKFVYFEKFTR